MEAVFSSNNQLATLETCSLDDVLGPMAPAGSGEEGNTNPPPPSKKTVKKRCNAAKYWCFTWNNYPNNWLDLLAPNLVGMEWIAGEEVGELGTPHIQGYIESPNKIRPLEKFGIKAIHWEVAKGNQLQNIIYCTKEGKHHGTLKLPNITIKMKYENLRYWQKKIADMFVEPEDPLFGRSVYWFWESTGNIGKSVLCTYFVDNCKCIILSGSAADMKFGVMSYVQKNNEGPEMVIMDIPRCQDKVSIKGIEEIKNGCFFSSKYESGMCRYNRPHVLVFSNAEPDTSEMSLDRWKIVDLSSVNNHESYIEF